MKRDYINQLKDICCILFIMNTDIQETTTGSESIRFTGRVKWFNNKAGYGFITVTDAGNMKDTDIFVHHSGVVVDNEQYKYLVQGEYVSFDLKKMERGDHEFHAFGVRGVSNGMLMCETRNENKNTRPNRSDGDVDGEWKSSSTNSRSNNGRRRESPTDTAFPSSENP